MLCVAEKFVITKKKRSEKLKVESGGWRLGRSRNGKGRNGKLEVRNGKLELQITNYNSFGSFLTDVDIILPKEFCLSGRGGGG